MSVIPKIRFKGFNDAWEQRKLGDITSLITKGTTPKDKSGHGEVNFIKVENIDETSGEVIGLSKISLEEHQGYLKRSQLQEGDILFSIAGTLGRVISINSDILPANTNQALSIIRLKEGNLDYVKTCLKGNVVADFIRRNPTIGAQPNLSLEQVSNLEIGMPSIVEQEKIGGYFKRLDNLITLHQRKCDETKELKKYMLQKMFPQKGEKVPELRFEGFAEDWEQRKLNEVAEKICVGFVGTCEKFYTDESGVPMYRTGNLNGLSLNRDDLKYVTNEFHQHNQKSQLIAGDILIARHGDSGKAVNYESSEEANCLNIVIIRPDFKKCNYKFLTNCINSPECQKHIKSLSAGSTQAVINTSEIEKLGVVMPANIDEQNKIARYFSNLDNLITLHQRKCDSLKELKKYMLQNMFPKEK